MLGNKVVARFLDGRVVKGTTQNFAPARPTFHVFDESASESVEVEHEDLKAVFFVKSLEGDPDHEEDLSLEDVKGHGRKIRVTFRDGEEIAGLTSGYSENRPGFFVFPADEASNNERVYVLSHALRDVELQ